MEFSQMATVTMILFIVIYVGQFFLQYWLSIRDDRWMGWILPILNLGGGVMYLISATTVGAAVMAFLTGGGISAAIQLLLYYIGRKRVQARQRDRVDKMNIQDL